MIGFRAGRIPNTRRVMFFIDSGYLRESLRQITGDENFALHKFPQSFAHKFMPSTTISPELIRTYYYDAIYDVDNPLYKERKSYFDALNSYENVEVKLGNLIKTTNGYRQKGVDILLTIDVLTKAYQDHFDYAILFCGDRDFLPLVKVVKDATGKKVCGMVFDGHFSNDLRNEFDKCIIIKSNEFHLIR